MSARILINLLNFRPGHIGGTETYIRSIVKNLEQLRPPEKFILVLSSQNRDQFNECSFEKVSVDWTDSKLIRSRFLESLTPYRARSIESRINEIAADLIWYPQQSIFPKVRRTLSVLTIHDLQHLYLPRNIPLTERIFRRGIYGHSIHSADRLIAISQETADAIIANYGAESENIDIIHHGFESQIKSDDALYDLPGSPFVYYPAATYPHKNHIGLIESVAKLDQAHLWDFGKLVFTGQKTGHWESIQKTIFRAGLSELVEHRGFVSRGEVNALYKAAAIVVFPSLYEGFGIPILEAAAMSKRFLASPLKLYAELGLPKKHQVDFSDHKSLREKLTTVGSLKLEKPISSWRNSAEQHLACFRKVLGQRLIP